MKSKQAPRSRTFVAMFSALMATAVLTALPTRSLEARPASPSPQATQSCIEDFTSDIDPTMPGIAGSVFSHTISGNFILGPGFPGGPPGHALELFAGATDVITFPGQTVTYAQVQIFSFSPGMVVFEGVRDILTTRFSPAPLTQFRQVTDATMGDNNLPLGQIVKVTLTGFETLFDNVQISPCALRASMVEVLVRPGSINPQRDDGLIKAVILSDASIDATSVDPTTVQFGAATVAFRYFIGDEDEDGDLDLIFFFLIRDVGIRCGDTAVPLTGRTTTGRLIEGEGAIQTVSCH